MNKYFFLFCLSAGLAFAQVNTESFRKDYDSTGFAGNIGLDFTSHTGNTELQLLSISTRLNYNFGKSYSFIFFNSDFGWKDKKSFSNLALFHLRYVAQLTDAIQLEGFTQYNYDKSRLLLNRELIGGGARIKIFKSEMVKVRLGISGMFEFEEYDLKEGSTHPRTVSDFRLSSYLSFKASISDDTEFISVTYYQPLPKDFNDVKMISENTLQTKINESLKIVVKFNARFDSKPPDNRKELDTTTRVGFVYEF